MGVKDLLQGNNGPMIAGVALVAGCVLVYLTVLAPDGRSELLDSANNRWYVDEGGKAFRHEMKAGDPVEVRSPDGKKAWPAELCYWTKDGKRKDAPTPVLLNSLLGKPEPTFCPDCDRLVVPLNPVGLPGATPPPTRDEAGKGRRS